MKLREFPTQLFVIACAMTEDRANPDVVLPFNVRNLPTVFTLSVVYERK